ncbi:MAG: sugar transporter, partial [Segetibacter sp.]|nr:sugar transporter [Segetibacter sp.]
MYIETERSPATALGTKQAVKVPFYVIRISLIAALGGFLFGFETAVISGAEKTIQELWNLS